VFGRSLILTGRWWTKEIIEARIWAGLYFRTPDVQAAELGKNVAEFMEESYFQPLD
jgi:hypothetical protein